MRWFWALVAGLLIAGGGCNSQTAELTQPVTYVAVGASDTVGVGAKDPVKDAWVAQLHRRLPKGSKFVRLGVSGSTAAQALVEQIPRAEKEEADLITVWLAVNDFNARVEVSEYQATLTTILRRLGAGGSHVFVGNVPDLAFVPIYKAIPKVLLSRRIEEYNQAIDAAADETGAFVVDLFEPSQELAKDGGSFISEDGFHPSEEGYRLLADAFWKEIQSSRIKT
ncbi:MAG TPA: SGNH/GDSL hydrolase family protein [Actinomycetota bacterium]|nr:SGNH/GDSL hydrolase family protein [Actinomycetota bacterium]